MSALPVQLQPPPPPPCFESCSECSAWWGVEEVGHSVLVVAGGEAG